MTIFNGAFIAYKDAVNALLEAGNKAQVSLIQIRVRHDEFKENCKNLVEFDCYTDTELMQHIYNLYLAPTVTRYLDILYRPTVAAEQSF